MNDHAVPVGSVRKWYGYPATTGASNPASPGCGGPVGWVDVASVSTIRRPSAS